jgi:hypothetical protein
MHPSLGMRIGAVAFAFGRSAMHNLVVPVVSMSANGQMRGITAGRIVADQVTTDKAPGDRTIRQLPSKAMRVDLLALDLNDTIAAVPNGPPPGPAGIRASRLVDMRPKAFPDIPCLGNTFTRTRTETALPSAVRSCENRGIYPKLFPALFANPGDWHFPSKKVAPQPWRLVSRQPARPWGRNENAAERTALPRQPYSSRCLVQSQLAVVR